MDTEHSPQFETEQSAEPYGLLNKRLNGQEKRFGRRWCGFFDIDGTTYREGVDNTSLRDQIEEGLWGLTYVTGTDMNRVVRLINEGKIPVPLAVGSNLGTRRFYLKEHAANKSPATLTIDDFQEDIAFRSEADHIAEPGKTFRQTIHDRLLNNGFNLINAPFNQDKTPNVFSSFNLRFTQDYNETNFKLWCELDPHKLDLHISVNPQNRALIQHYQEYLQRLYPQYDLSIYYGYTPDKDKADQEVWNVHFLPKNSWGKERFVQDICKLLNAKGLIAGDTGNDIGQLFSNYNTENIKDLIRAAVGGSNQSLTEVIRDPSLNNERHSSFRRLNINGMTDLRVYDETHTPLTGPASLARVMNILQRAWNIFSPRTNTSST